jgi:hypothetical protein
MLRCSKISLFFVSSYEALLFSIQSSHKQTLGNKTMKAAKHLGQSVTLGALLVLTSVGVIGLIAMQSTLLP